MGKAFLSHKQKQVKVKVMLYYPNFKHLNKRGIKLKDKQHTGRRYLQEA